MTPEKKPQEIILIQEPHRSGCVVCGAKLVYFETYQDKACHYCGQVISANARCVKGHLVCDRCHSKDGMEIIKQDCLHSRELDAVALMHTIRSHPRFPLHGSEHHALVPAVILTALKNAGNAITEEQIITGIQRCKQLRAAPAHSSAPAVRLSAWGLCFRYFRQRTRMKEKRDRPLCERHNMCWIRLHPIMHLAAVKGIHGWHFNMLRNC